MKAVCKYYTYCNLRNREKLYYNILYKDFQYGNQKNNYGLSINDVIII